MPLQCANSQESVVKFEARFPKAQQAIWASVLELGHDRPQCNPLPFVVGTAVRAWSDGRTLSTIHSVVEQNDVTFIAGDCYWRAFEHKRLRPENKALLAFLKEWMATPDELGDEWWEEFEDDLKMNRLSFDR